MNPMNNIGNGFSPELMQSIRNAKGVMQMMNGNPSYLLQQNPALSQVLQMTKGQNPKDVFYSMARAKGINPDALLRELQK